MTRISTFHRQRGAALAISLFILLALTLIGIAGLNRSVMQEKMAASTQRNSITFQKAESAITKTYFDYRSMPGTLVTKAQSTTASDRQFNYTALLGGDSQAELRYVAKTTAIGYSLGENISAAALEVVGTSTLNNTGMQAKTIQGLRAEPILDKN